ncbi:alpha-(1-3)-fucosyltransferase C-like [Brachionus plicatilis]|uniref:Fucosyltransferase n=1 Tax=Brachionus plicatilis TaxID=10195 RepID=A0A3M7PXG8_BRAPC|nr:alpha-(1-3)-fucosyltransferase C-like [Brachionus plicatilis]
MYHLYRMHGLWIIILKDNGVEYAQSLPLNLKRSIDFEHLNHFSRVPTILLWTPFWRWKDFGFGLGYKQPFIRNGCPVFNCEITNDKTKYNESDLIVFHARMNFSFPHYRLRDQRWIFTEFESPIHSPNYTKFNNIFNFTFTYRVESEFSRTLSSGYRMFEYGRNFSFDENKDFSKGKTGFAAAVISNCKSNSGRDIFINKLKQFIPVSIYGKCGKICTDKFKALSKCKRLIGKKYKFYLSFENSICNGYITEKFFEILRYDIIPVVLGGGQYTKFRSISFHLLIFFSANLLFFAVVKFGTKTVEHQRILIETVLNVKKQK